MVGQVIPLVYFGRDLVAWRDESEQIHVMEAYCPHLGAHLGYGGTVCGELIQCPFHGWRYDAAGECAEVAYAARPNRRATIETFPSRERNGQVLVWYGAQGRGPSWEIPEVPELYDADYTGYLRRARWKVRALWQDIKENIIDTAHAGPVHGVATPVVSMSEAGACLTIRVNHLSDSPLGAYQDETVTEYHGPGVSIVRLRGSIDMCLVTGNTPIDEEHVDVRVALLVRKRDSIQETEDLAELIAAGQATLFEQDIPIWEHKIYRDRPALVPEDGPIMQFRRWARQFCIPLDTEGGVERPLNFDSRTIPAARSN